MKLLRVLRDYAALDASSSKKLIKLFKKLFNLFKSIVFSNLFE